MTAKEQVKVEEGCLFAFCLAQTECNRQRRRRRKRKAAASTQPCKNKKTGETREQLDEGIDWENREDVGGLGRKCRGAEEEGRNGGGCRDGGKVGMNGILGRAGRKPQRRAAGIRE